MDPLNQPTIINRLISFCLHNKLIVFILFTVFSFWGISVAPFDWNIKGLIRSPIPIDAIPDIGENQQIIFTEWKGRSPQDIEDQITTPLTISLMGIPSVKTVRSYSFFGFSSIYVIFKEKAEFYWSRSRVIEKLNSLPRGTLPHGVTPNLGPDATALGQIFWYTLEGRDNNNMPTGGWDLDELRSIQDYNVKYSLLGTQGVAEVASIGGFIKEYQIDINPDAMKAYGVNIEEIYKSIKMSNLDVGARSIEINGAEYIIRGVGFIKNLEDIRQSVIKNNEHIPITIEQVADVSFGPALRRGALDKSGAEAVGGVVVARYGENPLQVIKSLKDKINEISPSLPKRKLKDGSLSQIKIIPFYDRSILINQTLGTLQSAITEEILITMIVILLMVFHFRSALLISGLLPMAVLMTFILMDTFSVSANIVALSGIAIAIGTIVDMGIVVCENILKKLEHSKGEKNSLKIIYKACSEVSGAVLTAVATTIISFLPVFTMEAAEGKLFKPLAYTKTFALLASIILALFIIPTFAHTLFNFKLKIKLIKKITFALLLAIGSIVLFKLSIWAGTILSIYALINLIENFFSTQWKKRLSYLPILILVFYLLKYLSQHWSPLGLGVSLYYNFLFVTTLFFIIILFFWSFEKYYKNFLSVCLNNKATFLSLPLILIIWGLIIWLGFSKVILYLPYFISFLTLTIGIVLLITKYFESRNHFSLPITLICFSIFLFTSTSFKSNWLNDFLIKSEISVKLSHTFPGLSKEFMPSLDEGSFLYMPTTMPHASIGEAMDAMKKIDMAITAIPEVECVVGKLGRADSPLDPAPISMIETIINYKSEYITDTKGKTINFKYNNEKQTYVRNSNKELIPDKNGKPFRQWREHIMNENDLWNNIVDVAQLPGTTSAPKLQPIAARIVMLQSGMRSPIGVKIKGSNLDDIESAGMQIEKILKEVPSVSSDTVFADRIVGKPYLEIKLNRKKVSRYGLQINRIQKIIETAIGGMQISTSVEGRERYPIRIRYQREKRDSIEELKNILIPTPKGQQIPLEEIADIVYIKGPMVIKSEDSFLIGYVLLDKKDGYSEVTVVDDCKQHLNESLKSGELVLAKGTTLTFAGNYENQIRSEKKLIIVLPLALFLIFILLYLQFKSIIMSFIVGSGILVAWAGGFQMIWLYSQDWFLNFSIFETNLRDLFSIHPYNLSVAVWVGFLALFGIASDDGVLMLTYIKNNFAKNKPNSIQSIRSTTIEAAQKRIRPCLMTVATTIIALIPVLMSTGRGSDIMVPMAIPTFGGMSVALMTVFVVPTLNCLYAEIKFIISKGNQYHL